MADRPFPKSKAQTFQQQYRDALHRHFLGQLDQLQLNARTVERASGIRPVAPDLWLIEPSGNHRFIEVKLARDEVSESQLAGLAVIAASLRGKSSVSVELIELHWDTKSCFDGFVEHLT